MKIYYLFVAAASAASAAWPAASAHAQSAATARPVENFVSPPQLFPAEGKKRATYQPLLAYDRPFGTVAGEVRAELSACPAAQDEPECGVPLSWHVDLNNGAHAELETAQVEGDQRALLSYQPARRAAGMAWSRISYPGGAFWIRTDGKDVSSFESRANYVEQLDSWCSRPGRCGPVPAAMRKEIARIMAGDYELATPAPHPYDIAGIVTVGGKRYYKLKRTEAVEGKPQPAIPATGYIPTRHRDGSHAGDFSPNGC
ncbi:hypothetical protein ACLB1G_01310 [Oxalobacteraceae bacterium A2-2]